MQINRREEDCGEDGVRDMQRKCCILPSRGNDQAEHSLTRPSVSLGPRIHQMDVTMLCDGQAWYGRRPSGRRLPSEVRSEVETLSADWFLMKRLGFIWREPLACASLPSAAIDDERHCPVLDIRRLGDTPCSLYSRY